ncbi:MAG: hypothetical protein MUF13_15890 [Akkermansiaceae bacterium]|jgi:hypothetical protein|nr:hypothetical protein [Akkermansiaceae bacterium]
MPIKLNLLAEQQQADDLRRRDPVKRTAYAGGLALALMFAYYGLLHVQAISINSSLKLQQDRLADVEKKSQQAIAALKRSAGLESRIKALQTVSTNRFLWANALNALQHTTAPDVQFVRVKGKQIFIVDPPPADPKAPKKPRYSTEQFHISIEARDYADASALNHTKLMAEVGKAPALSPYLKHDDAVVLKERGSLQPDPIDPARSFIRFIIECRFPETKRTL